MPWHVLQCVHLVVINFKELNAYDNDSSYFVLQPCLNSRFAESKVKYKMYDILH